MPISSVASGLDIAAGGLIVESAGGCLEGREIGRTASSHCWRPTDRPEGRSRSTPEYANRPGSNRVAVGPVPVSRLGRAGGNACPVPHHFGDILVELFDAEKPATVSNFLHYAGSGYWTNLFTHRVVPGFVVQAGGYAVSGRNTAGAQFVQVPGSIPSRMNSMLGPVGATSRERWRWPSGTGIQFRHDRLVLQPGRQLSVLDVENGDSPYLDR